MKTKAVFSGPSPNGSSIFFSGEGVLVENFEFSVIEDTNVVCVNDDGPWNCSVI